MKIELKNVIIKSKTDLKYLNNIKDYIDENEKRILSFFKLNKLNKKYNVIIMPFNEFKSFIKDKYGQYNDYVRGDTDKESRTIRILSIEDQLKYTTHKNVTLDDYLKMILHEFVHACNDELNNDYNETIWFSEGLATNLSNQSYKIMNLSNCDFEKLKKDWYNYGPNKYDYAYTIVKHIINNYSQDEIIKLISDSKYLRDKCDNIFKEILFLQ